MDRKRFYAPGAVVAALVAAFLAFFHLLPARPGSTGTEPAKRAAPPRHHQGAVHYRDRVAVLLYHRVVPVGNGRGTISLGRFEADLRALRENNYHFISVGQLADFLEGRGSIPPNAVVLTFDDGYREFSDCVFPLLKRYHIPATLFIIGKAPGRDPAFLTWEQLCSLEQSGLVTVGGHTYDQHYGVPASSGGMRPVTITSVPGRRETEREYERRMLEDSRRCQETMLFNLGHITPYFAYPYGAYTPSLVRILRSAGYRYMFTVLIGTNTRSQDKARLYRIDAGKPELSSRDLLALLRYAALNPDRPHGPPSAWWPEEWKE